MTPVLKFIDRPYGLSYDEIFGTSAIFMAGGSETSATLLCGLIYGLLTTPEAYQKLANEIRSAYRNPSEITAASTNKLEYLSMCLSEAPRMLPPLPGNLRRITPPGGWTVAGWDVPGNTLVAVDALPAWRSASNFHDPERFAPERWSADPPAEFANDKLKVVQVFSVGPRNCIGKNLALMEAKMILTNLFYNFDIVIMPECANYIHDLKVWGFWKREKFMVKLTPVTASASGTV